MIELKKKSEPSATRLMISQNIKTLLKQKDYTVEKLAEVSRISRNHLYQIIMCTHDIRFGSLERIANALDVPVHFFFDLPTADSDHKAAKEEIQRLMDLLKESQELNRLYKERIMTLQTCHNVLFDLRSTDDPSEFKNSINGLTDLIHNISQ